MAIYKEDIVDIELTTGLIYRSFLQKSIGEGDKLGDRFGIRALRNGVEETLGGTCTGYFIRPTGDTVVITGTVSGATAYVDLPEACYAYEGQFALAIKVSGGGVTGTLRIVDGVVSNTTTGSVVDPGTVIPSIEDLIDAIEAAVESIPSDYSGLWTSVAPAFSNLINYDIGEYVSYDGKVYRFVKPHAAGTWASADVQQVSVGPEITNNKTALEGVPTRNIIDDFPFGSGENYDITCKQTGSGTYHLSGTKGTGSGLEEFVLYRSLSAFPQHIKKDVDYCICVGAGDAFVLVSAYYNNSTTGSTVVYRSPRPLDGAEEFNTLRIPEDATGMAITIRIDDAESFDEDVTIYLVEQASVDKRNAITKAIVLPGDSFEGIENIIAGYPFISSTVNGVKGKRTGDDTFYFSGTKGAASWTTIDLYRNRSVMPSGFEAGKTYCIYLNSYDVSFWVVKYNGADDTYGVALYKSEDNKHGDQYGVFTIPAEDVQGLSLAFKCENAESFDETVTLFITEQKTKAERSFITSVNATTSISEKKMFSIGNSFLRGVVYTNGSETEKCTWKDAIYGQIAMSLNISEENTDMVYHGNTGFISLPQSPVYDSHSDVILETDLSEYDYLLTHFNGGDLRSNLGTEDADGTGTTLADAVVRVVEYIKTNKWICKLIILGTPPYSSEYAGDDIFIAEQGSSGNSINEMDNLMYKLALKYHFIYVSWQDLEISYHYMDFADYHPGDTGARHADSVDTYRALGEYAATQIPAVSSAIAVSKLMNSIGG